ncbi:hypothetical protein KIW84_032387 [Lathyrus oleraceus]|uniref:Uncharacterized protein n=1 Tax=Pisum sativum TaxID=3888 RepID=A0A9D5AWJ0_PEA|nr:hypothetical protein KIW84_032387 [Pisum sativum]
MGQTLIGGYLGSCFSKQGGNTQVFSSVVSGKRHIDVSLSCQIGFTFGLFVCNLSSGPAHAETDYGNENRNDDCDESNVKLAHGKKVHADYSVIGFWIVNDFFRPVDSVNAFEPRIQALSDVWWTYKKVEEKNCDHLFVFQDFLSNPGGEDDTINEAFVSDSFQRCLYPLPSLMLSDNFWNRYTLFIFQL